MECEPDHENRKPRKSQDCIALYKSRDYNMSDWECEIGQQGKPWVVNNIICRNPEYIPEKACNCECDECHIYGDPHVHTFDGTYYHPMVCKLYTINNCFSFIFLIAISQFSINIFYI